MFIDFFVNLCVGFSWLENAYSRQLLSAGNFYP